MCRTPLIIGIAGGTGSGKTTIVGALINVIGKERVAYVQQDSYYKDRSSIPLKDRENMNYDHPDALESSLLAYHLQKLRKGFPIEKPIYDFKTHTRNTETERVSSKETVVVEGVFIFVERTLRDLMNIKVFVDTDADIRFIRRLKRDISDRGRTVESVINQYVTTVRPMHLKFVEPTKKHADIVIPGVRCSKSGIEKVVSMIKAELGDLR